MCYFAIGCVLFSVFLMPKSQLPIVMSFSLSYCISFFFLLSFFATKIVKRTIRHRLWTRPLEWHKKLLTLLYNVVSCRKTWHKPRKKKTAHGIQRVVGIFCYFLMQTEHNNNNKSGKKTNRQIKLLNLDRAATATKNSKLFLNFCENISGGSMRRPMHMPKLNLQQ